MGNYKGYFRANDATTANTAETLYCVYFIGNSGSSEYTEIQLDADSPFVVTYDTSNTPFDPVRTSTATINVVHNNYMRDIMSPYAQGTEIKLKNETNNTYVWEGYLKPSVYDADYENEYERFSFVANDKILTLQYLNYTDDSAYTKSIVTVSSILGKICDDAGLSDGFYWPRTKKIGNAYVAPTSLKISEQNFFTTDTEEPWKMDVILEEICKYFGMTAVQWQQGLYLIDYQNYHNNDTISFMHYTTPYTTPSTVSKGGVKYIVVKDGSGNITTNNVRGNASVIFEPIYNKCRVNCNFNEIENFIPDLFGDDLLTNRFNSDNFYENIEILPPAGSETASYWWGTNFWGNQKWRDEESADTQYRYFHRYYDHKYWESCYYNSSGSRVYPSASVQATSSITRDYAGATIVDMGVVRKKYYDSETHQYIVPNKLDYTRYICVSQKGLGNYRGTNGVPVLKLKSGFQSVAPLSTSSFLVISYTAIFEKYVNRAYINPDWAKEGIKPGGMSWSLSKTDGQLYFRLKIGNKYWNGSQWTTTSSTFRVTIERTNDDVGYINEERNTLNNVSWDEYVNEEGYKIPLEGVDTCAPLDFEILFPNLQFVANGNDTQWNQYCWIKDFKLLCVQKGQDAETQESDVVYENDIDTDAINEISEISLKLTTATELTKPSYSNVIYQNNTGNTMLEKIKEDNISGVAQKPEQNIIEKYVNYYSTPTKKIEINVVNNFTPFDCVYNLDTENMNKGFIQLGAEINYAENNANITFIETK